jgi:hypothetical protein
LARADGNFETGKARGSGAFSNSLQKVILNMLCLRRMKIFYSIKEKEKWE